jgi:hypothetical protein
MSAAVYVLRQVNGVTIRQTEEGDFDATAMCRAWGKFFNNYQDNDETKKFVEQLSLKTGIPVIKLVRSTPGRYGGSWVHWRVALDLAQWCSPEFKVMVNGWIAQIATGEVPVVTGHDHQLINQVKQFGARLVQVEDKQLQFDQRLVKLERTTRKDPKPAQVRLLARVALVCYGGMDPANGQHRVVDTAGNRLPGSHVDHFNELRHDNRTANLWLIHDTSHRLKTGGQSFLPEFRVFQNRLKQLGEPGPKQPGLFD